LLPGTLFAQGKPPAPRVAPLSPGFDVGPRLVCGNLGKNSSSETIKGPFSTSALLSVGSGDDGAKESHECEIYVNIDMPGRPEPGAGNIYNSIAGYGRPFSVRADGFSQDGKHIVGLVSEGGEFPATFAFDYGIATDHADLADIKRYLDRLRGAQCGTAMDIAGLTKSGMLVLEPTAAKPCQPLYRASLNPKTGQLRNLPAGETFIPLYRTKSP
jgi:hypothetical protein